MRALVTGVGGFVGGHLAREFADDGYEVHGLDIHRHGPLPDGVEEIHVTDVLDGGAVARLVGDLRPDVVVHLAGAASVRESFDHPLRTWRLNLDGTLSVLEAVRTARSETTVLAVTSSEMYGLVPLDSLPVTEATPARPHSPYGASKAAADLAIAQYHDGYGLRALRARPFNHLGPGQDNRFLVPSVAEQIARGEAGSVERIEVRVGNTETRRDFLDVRDVVHAYRLIIDQGDPRVPYVIGSGRSRSVQEILDGLAAQARNPVDFVVDPARRREGEQPDLYGSSERLTSDTGWSPRFSLNETLRDTLDFWRARVAEEE